MTDGKSSLEASDLYWRRGRREILDVPVFRLASGKITALIGPNGAGKTSLLMMLALLEKPTGGRIIVNGEEVSGHNALAIRRSMAVIFQEPLLMRTSVENNIREGLRLRGISPRKADEHAAVWMERLNVSHLKKRPAWELSGGEAQRVNLARALAFSPDILFMDEPFNGLDFPSRDQLMRSLKAIFHEVGTSVLLVTHDPREASKLAEEIVMMESGHIVDSGSFPELKEKHSGDESFFRQWSAC